MKKILRLLILISLFQSLNQLSASEKPTASSIFNENDINLRKALKNKKKRDRRKAKYQEAKELAQGLHQTYSLDKDQISDNVIPSPLTESEQQEIFIAHTFLKTDQTLESTPSTHIASSESDQQRLRVAHSYNVMYTKTSSVGQIEEALQESLRRAPSMMEMEQALRRRDSYRAMSYFGKFA